MGDLQRADVCVLGPDGNAIITKGRESLKAGDAEIFINHAATVAALVRRDYPNAPAGQSGMHMLRDVDTGQVYSRPDPHVCAIPEPRPERAPERARDGLLLNQPGV